MGRPTPQFVQDKETPLRLECFGSRLGRALATLLLAMLCFACAGAPAVGRGGRVYGIRIASLNGMPTAARGPRSYPACVIQVGDQVARVWLANPTRELDQSPSPVLMEADAEALKQGILLERSWHEAIVHEVTDAELAAGAALVYIPGVRKPTAVELRFEPIARVSSR